VKSKPILYTVSRGEGWPIIVTPFRSLDILYVSYGVNAGDLIPDSTYTWHPLDAKAIQDIWDNMDLGDVLAFSCADVRYRYMGIEHRMVATVVGKTQDTMTFALFEMVPDAFAVQRYLRVGLTSTAS
jgi:hypothetical protein